jgi:hypothetical protein
MSSRNNSVQNYINTLIFCIVAKAITIILLGLLFTDIGKQLAYFIITIEFGLISVIIVSIYQIVNYEKKKLGELDALRVSKVNIQSCPDYYTRRVGDDERAVCENIYISPDNSHVYEFSTSEFVPDDLFENKNFGQVCDRMQTIGGSGPNFNDTAWTDIKAKCHYFTN